MKNKVLNSTMMILAVMLVAATATFAQKGNRATGSSCCMNIPGLSEQQKTEITAMEKQHLQEMQEMRETRRKSGTYADRDAYQTAVERKVTEHRTAVRNLLDADQKVIFDNIQSQGGQGINQQTNTNRGRGQKGAMQGIGRGKGFTIY
jgi:hypothetical protein